MRATPEAVAALVEWAHEMDGLGHRVIVEGPEADPVMVTVEEMHDSVLPLPEVCWQQVINRVHDEIEDEDTDVMKVPK